MDKDFNGTSMKQSDFWAQRETFLNNVEVATQNRARFAKLQAECGRLYQEAHVVTVTSRLLRTKLTRALNKYNFL